MRSSSRLVVFLAASVLFTGVVLFYTAETFKGMDSVFFGGQVLSQEYKPAYLKFFDDVKKEYVLEKKDFLEANLDEMKIRLFRQGEVVKEVPMLAKGDNEGWGGSAAGLYSITSGYQLSYSNIAQVYMPYALHYYGKYYIHGEPYYPSGEKLDSQFSGGCLRLNDEDAQSIFELSDLNMPVLVIDKEKDYTNYKPALKKPKISAQSFLVADLDSGFVFAEKNSSDVMPIASLTKLMTAVVAAENIDLSRSVLIDQNIVDSGYGSTDGLEPGQRFRIVELFYPLLIESSNDSAYALTKLLGYDKTINLMNEKAKSILMENTEFVEPSGYNPANVSTAKDLFYLARYILNNRYPILEITKGNKVTSFGPVSFDIKNLWNKNLFIEDQTFIGGKTGYIKESKNTGLFIFDFAGRKIAFAFLDSSDLKLDTQKLYIWLQNTYFN
jgi:D-alanyl-D-alanine carboxypeptidase/L,D-transpeptidase catalytic domain